MKSLRIAFITHFFPLKGGIARFSGLLRDALLHRGYDVVPVSFKALYPEFLSKGAFVSAHTADAWDRSDRLSGVGSVGSGLGGDSSSEDFGRQHFR